jgi:methanogenic corrinoid protein MtbC1
MVVENLQVIEFEEALLSLNRVAAKNLITHEFTGDNALELINNIITPALESIGNMWSRGEIALSQEYMAAKICEEIVEKILPLESSSRKEGPVIGITTLGDEHMLGKRIVASFIRANGFNIHDYSHMETEKIAIKAKEDGVEVIMVSTLMLHLAYEVKKLRYFLDSEGVNTKIIVGGAPFLFDRDLWKEVGADAMAVDAMESVKKIYEIRGHPK